MTGVWVLILKDNRIILKHNVAQHKSIWVCKNSQKLDPFTHFEPTAPGDRNSRNLITFPEILNPKFHDNPPTFLDKQTNTARLNM